MKRPRALLLLLLCSLVHSQTVIPKITADFESATLPAGWRRYQNATAFGWLFGPTSALGSSSFRIPNRLGNVAVDNDDSCGTTCNGAFDIMDTSTFTQDPSLGETFVEFDSFYTGGFGQIATLAYSTTGMDGVYTPFLDVPSSSVWERLHFELPPLPANASVSVRFWSDDDGSWAGGWAIDNVLIAQNDWTGVVPQCVSLLSPTNNSGIPVSSASITWRGSQNRFPFGYYVSVGTDNPPTNVYNRADVRKSTSITLPPLDSGSIYYFTVIPYGKDGVEGVGCPIWSFIASLPPAQHLGAPYFQDFESDNGGWFSGGALSSWAYGTPNKTNIKTAHSGNNVWVSGGLTGTYNNLEQSWIQSPNFNFSGNTNTLYVSMWLFSDLETSYDGAKFQYTTDNTIWNDVGAFGDPYWYDDYSIDGLPRVSDGWTGRYTSWKQVAHFLPVSLSGESRVSFRIFFGSDESVLYSGIAMDDFEIGFVPVEAPLCVENRFPIPGDDDLALRVSLSWQRSASEHPLLPVGATLSFGTDNPPTNSLNGIDIGKDVSYELPELSPGVTYFWQVVPYGFDGVRSTGCPVWNFTVVASQTSFPYTEDFEDGEGGWAPLGTASSWAFGSPNKTTIKGCGSGSFCWVNGGLTGNYGDYENNYVLSPVFDFRSLQFDPFIVMKVFWEIEKNYDGANVQFLHPNGTWLTVGTHLDGTNWYTSNRITGLPGGSLLGWSGDDGDGSNGWVVANHELVGAAGIQTKIRINFGSDNSIEDDGFAFDDIKIIPAPTGVVPECASVIYPPNQMVNVPVPATFNLQWSLNSSVVGLPRGFTLKYGLTSPPTNSLDNGLLDTFPVVNVNLTRGTKYYWQIVPYGYNNLAAVNCPVWSFTTVPNPPTTAPTFPPTSAPTQAPTQAPSQPQTSAQLTQTRTSAQTSAPARTSAPIQIESSSKGGGNGGAVAAAVIIPILVFIIIVVVAVLLYNRFSKKNRDKRNKLHAAERELDDKATTA